MFLFELFTGLLVGSMLLINHNNTVLQTLGTFVSPEKGSVNGPSIAFNLLQKLLRYLGCFETIDTASKLPPRAPPLPPTTPRIGQAS